MLVSRSQIKDLLQEASKSEDAMEQLQLSIKGSNLRYMDLTALDFTGIDLSGIDLSHANLGGAILTGASFKGSVITETNFDNAIDANLEGAVEDLKDAV